MFRVWYFAVMITFSAAIITPPTQLAVFKRILSSYKSFVKDAQLTKLHSDFNSDETQSMQQHWNAVKTFLATLPKAKQAGVKTVLMELLDNQAEWQDQVQEIQIIFKSVIDTSMDAGFNAQFLELDKATEGTLSYFTNLTDIASTVWPEDKYPAEYKILNPYVEKHKTATARMLAFFKWDGKSKSIYFRKKGYKRAAAAWQNNVNM